jgi:hypothetical protein
LTAVKDVRGALAEFIRRNIHPGSVLMPPTDDTTRLPERVPTMQRILDNPFLLLFLGVTIPTVLYLIWGVMEVASIPLGK